MEVLYKKLDTGELLTRKEMIEVYEEEYDGNDPTNVVPWYYYFEEVRFQ